MRTDGLHYFIKLVNEWRGEYHTDKKGVIILQNKATMTNVRFTNASMHKIQQHSRGVEQLPDTVMQPDEIWAKWKDVKTQKIVLKVYIRSNYVVFTEDGQITDAFLVKSADRYRNGCLVTW